MASEILSIFDHEYFKLSKKLLLLTGLWPYETSTKKIAKRVLFTILLICITIPNINGARVWCSKDFAICGENVAGLLYITEILAKYFSTMIFEKKIKDVYELIGQKWDTIKDSSERKILRKYAKEGKDLGKFYVVYVLASAVAFSQSGMINTVLDLVYPLNESRPKILPVKGEFFFDPFEHFYKLYVAYCIAAAVSTPVFLGVDSMYIAVVHQSLATFNIVQYRLTQASNCYVKDKALGYNTIISAIRMHKDALHFLDVISSSYGVCLLLLVALAAVFLSLGVIVILEHTDSPLDVLRFTMFQMGVVIHTFCMSWPGQKVIDQSDELFFHIYSIEWFSMDKKGKNLIKIMMLRCSRQATLTACGMYIMSFENFAKIIKAASSYTAVAFSLRE